MPPLPQLRAAPLSGGIQRANLDGSNVEDLVTELSTPESIALDLAGGKMYWVDDEAGATFAKLQRANLDGSNIETFVFPSLIRSSGLALDIDSGNLYMTLASARPEIDPGKILRVNLEPFTIEVVVTGLHQPFGIALSGTATEDACDLDGDDGGVPDTADQCPTTPRTPIAAVVIVNPDGCAIVDLCPCDNNWKNHVAYVFCVRSTAKSFVASNLITKREKRTTVSEARQSSCGRKK